MAKRKTGLHKELSTILDGALIPQKNGSQPPNGNSAPMQQNIDIPQSNSPVPNLPNPAQQVPPTGPAMQGPKAGWALQKAISSKAIDKLRIQQARTDGLTKLFKQIPWQIFHSRAIRSEGLINQPPSTDVPPPLAS